MSGQTPLSTLTRNKFAGLTSSLFDKNSAPQKMPGSSQAILKDLGPDGFWDRNTGKRGPTGPLQSDYNKKAALEKNILTNQTPHVQYINLTHIVVPQRLPNSEDNNYCWLDLAKSVHAGDVVFALRCPPPMVAAQYASRLTRKTGFNYTCAINLATVNYILFRLQTFFFMYEEICCNPIQIHETRGNVDEWKRLLQDKTTSVQGRGEGRFKQWREWFNLIIEEQGVKLDDILAWSDRTRPQNRQGCFFEKWWNEVLVDNMDTIQKVATEGDDDLLVNFEEGVLRKLFRTRVEALLWDFVHTNMNTLGVFIGSEEQGGSHQEHNAGPVSWPNDYAGTIQLTGKSRRVSNLWNREQGFSSGASLGFKFELKEFTNKTSVEFNLSSNPATATTVKTCDMDSLFPFKSSVFWVLTPSLSSHEYTPLAESAYVPQTFWRFACANQMSKQMNFVVGKSKDLALNAEVSGQCPPIEVIMRRSFEDNRQAQAVYLDTVLKKFCSDLNANSSLSGSALSFSHSDGVYDDFQPGNSDKAPEVSSTSTATSDVVTQPLVPLAIKKGKAKKAQIV
jgi:hypothetical protein